MNSPNLNVYKASPYDQKKINDFDISPATRQGLCDTDSLNSRKNQKHIKKFGSPDFLNVKFFKIPHFL